MSSGPITSWEIDEETAEAGSDFTLLGSKITADGDCSQEIKRHLLLGRKVMTNLNSILKRRYITFPTKVRLVKAMVFPVVMYGCESWTVKKAEHWKIDAFELWCWRRLLRAPWTAKSSKQSIPKEISPGYSLEGLILKLKLQELVMDREAWRDAIHGVAKSQTSLSDWTELKGITQMLYILQGFPFLIPIISINRHFLFAPTGNVYICFIAFITADLHCSYLWMYLFPFTQDRLKFLIVVRASYPPFCLQCMYTNKIVVGLNSNYLGTWFINVLRKSKTPKISYVFFFDSYRETLEIVLRKFENIL